MTFTKPQINAPTSACYLGKLYVQSLKSFLLNADRTLGENVFRFFFLKNKKIYIYIFNICISVN